MNRNENLLLLAWFVVVLLVLVLEVSTVFGVLGAVVGVFLGLPVARRRALGSRPTGVAVVRRGAELRRLGPSIGAHLAVLVALVIVAAIVPGLRDRFVASLGALVTAGAATVTAYRVRG